MKMHSCLLLSLGLLLGGFSLSAQESSTKASPAKVPEPGTYQIRNQKYGDLLRPQDANSADGTRIVLYSAQPWKCMTWRLQPEKESAFRVQNLFTSKTFAVGGKGETAGSAVVQVPLTQSGAPAWQFTRLENGRYKITEPKSGKVLTAVKSGNDSQVTIAVEPWREGEEQKWELQKIDPKQLTM
jgi:hypothetical protein